MTELGLPTGNQLVLSNKVNLDELFLGIFENCVLEPATPFKLAIYCLALTLDGIDQLHHGFTDIQANRLMCLIVGILEKGDRPFKDVRRLVRFMDKTIWNGILEYYLQQIHSIKEGNDIHVNGRYFFGRRDVTIRLFQIRTGLFLFLRKLHYQWTKLSTLQCFEANEKFRKYIQDAEELECSFMDGTLLSSVPLEIESAARAKKWMDRQIHLLQVCPSLAMNPDQIFAWCGIVKHRHRDINANLLEMIMHINLKNSMAAQESLRKFVDFSMFRPNIFDLPKNVNIDDMKRIGVINQRPLRHGTLMLARIYRMFGDLVMARSLLTESVQQAQTQNDWPCMRLAMLELTAIDILYSLEHHKSDKEMSDDPDHVPRVTLDSALRILMKEFASTELSFKGADFTQLHEFHENAVSLVNLLSVIVAARNGNLAESATGSLKQPLSQATSDDEKSKSRLIVDASTATLSSIRLHQGFWKSARVAALSLTEANGSDGTAPHHETEAYAIAGANIIYTYMAEGNWELASSALVDLVAKFPVKINWQASHHVSICKAIFEFDNALRLGKWKDLDNKLTELKSVAPDEAAIRQALLLSQRGELQDAEFLLKKELKSSRGKPVVFKYRLQLQLSTILAALDKLDDSLDLLLSIIEQTKSKSLYLLTSLAQRRLATFHADHGHAAEALKGYAKCGETVANMGTALEKCFYHLARSSVQEDANMALYDLAVARKYCQEAGFPIIEKSVLKEVALHFNKVDDTQKRDDICEQFVCMDQAHPGLMNWKLF
ncbi:unnamed protein product [Auanema sp. JU1783]|nr:unnamed protein product [Auanema sp. JU1783]